MEGKQLLFGSSKTELPKQCEGCKTYLVGYKNKNQIYCP